MLVIHGPRRLATKAQKIAVTALAIGALAAAFVVGSAARTYAQTGTRSTSTTSTRTTTPTTNTESKGRIDCPGNAENSRGNAKHKNPNCRTVR